MSFGLVAIPVKLYSATEQHDTPLHRVHVVDGARIRYRRVCEAEDAPVPNDEIGRGYELPGGDMVVITDEEFEALPLASSHHIDVMRFVPLEQVDSMYFAKSYYLQAVKAGAKPYVLLRDALTEANTAALVKVALRRREELALVRPAGDVLVLQTMLWPDEIRNPASLAPDETIHAKADEMKMAASYIKTLSGDFEPGTYTDEYAVALQSLVEEKVAGHEIAPAQTPAEEGRGQIIDLMAALRASVASAKKTGKPPEQPGTVTPIRPPKRSVKAAAPKKTKSPQKSKTTTKPAAKRSTSRRSA